MKETKLLTLKGGILPEIEAEGKAKGLDWRVPVLFVTRNEQTEDNIQKKLAYLKKKVDAHRAIFPESEKQDPTRKDAIAYLPFPVYGNIKGKWRKYTRAQADDLIQKIKEIRKYE